MANKKNGPGDGFRSWLTGQDNLGPMGKKWAKIAGAGLAGIGSAMGIQSRATKKNAFMREEKPGQNYNKNMKPEFKAYRKKQRSLPKDERDYKLGGAWTRNSRKHGS